MGFAALKTPALANLRGAEITNGAPQGRTTRRLPSSERFQKSHQVRDFPRRERQAARVLFLLEDLFERSGTPVVQERIATAHASQRRRVEFTITYIITQPDIVPAGRRVFGRDVAGRAFVLLENLPPANRRRRSLSALLPCRAATAAQVSRDKPSGR